MMLSPGEGENSAFVKLSVDALFLTSPCHLMNRVIHGQHQCAGGIAAIAPFQHSRLSWKLGGTSSAIASGSAEANDLFFKDGNFEGWIGL
jgi:hypothetical protein